MVAEVCGGEPFGLPYPVLLRIPTPFAFCSFRLPVVASTVRYTQKRMSVEWVGAAIEGLRY